MNLKDLILFIYLFFTISIYSVNSTFKYCREFFPKRNKIKTTKKLSNYSSTILSTESTVIFTNTSLTTTSTSSSTSNIASTTQATTSIRTTTAINYSNIYPSCNTGLTIIFLMRNPLYNFTYCHCDGVKMIIADSLVCDRNKLFEITATSICESAINPTLASANLYFTYIDRNGYYRVQGDQINNPTYCSWNSNRNDTRLLMSFLPDGY